MIFDKCNFMSYISKRLLVRLISTAIGFLCTASQNDTVLFAQWVQCNSEIPKLADILTYLD